jgi:hypothetical protein
MAFVDFTPIYIYIYIYNVLLGLCNMFNFCMNTFKGTTKGISCQIISLKNKDFYFFIFPFEPSNHGTLFLFNTHECQETQIKNLFDSILWFGLKNF